jgi:restriction endonuclease Mrr
VRSIDDQLPRFGTDDANILQDLVSLTPTGFEAAVVTLLRELNEVRHEVTRTQPQRDGGFDFAGRFTLPPPLQYEIDFLGEAKRFSRTTAVGPRYVSRLVARLGRGQYGLFVTTSYFTRQTQEEVLADGYPTRLLAGADLVRMMRELGLVRGKSISPVWLAAVDEEIARPLAEARRIAEDRAPYGGDGGDPTGS